MPWDPHFFGKKSKRSFWRNSRRNSNKKILTNFWSNSCRYPERNSWRNVLENVCRNHWQTYWWNSWRNPTTYLRGIPEGFSEGILGSSPKDTAGRILRIIYNTTYEGICTQTSLKYWRNFWKKFCRKKTKIQGRILWKITEEITEKKMFLINIWKNIW